ncbi:MAG: hypothetical protein L0170_02965, partial [Acidobacteria bacterium]|nr:hypothetical protein [Acidobacteriota bacterium]
SITQTGVVTQSLLEMDRQGTGFHSAFVTTSTATTGSAITSTSEEAQDLRREAGKRLRGGDLPRILDPRWMHGRRHQNVGVGAPEFERCAVACFENSTPGWLVYAEVAVRAPSGPGGRRKGEIHLHDHFLGFCGIGVDDDQRPSQYQPYLCIRPLREPALDLWLRGPLSREKRFEAEAMGRLFRAGGDRDRNLPHVQPGEGCLEQRGLHRPRDRVIQQHRAGRREVSIERPSRGGRVHRRFPPRPEYHPTHLTV